MENNHKLALYVTYYLSRFNKEALMNLNYSTWNNAFEDIGKILKVKAHSVKNWRDEFDPLFKHRAGWHQRPMSPSRVKVASALEDLNEKQIRGIVIDILSGKLKQYAEEEAILLSIVMDDSKNKNQRIFVPRGPTGKAAENYFIEYYNKHFLPVKGKLMDCRELGCGYDFKIKAKNDYYFVEVKGILDTSGGVLFTDKEWQIASEKENKYYLCVIKNLKANSEIKFIQNPVGKLISKKNIYSTIQISWSVTQKELNKLND